MLLISNHFQDNTKIGLLYTCTIIGLAYNQGLGYNIKP